MIEKTLKNEIYITKGTQDLRFERLSTKPNKTRLIPKQPFATRFPVVPLLEHSWKVGLLILNTKDESTKTRIQNLMN